MSEIDKLANLKRIAQALYDRKQHKFARLVKEENRLRTELRRLDDLHKQNAMQPSTDIALQSLGADILWQGWVGRSKTDLNMALARVLAQKEGELQDVRRAYGKCNVLGQLISQSEDKAARQRSQKALDAAIQIQTLP